MRAQPARQDRHRIRSICRVRYLRCLVHTDLRRLAERVGPVHGRQVPRAVQGHCVPDLAGDGNRCAGQRAAAVRPGSVLRMMTRCDGFPFSFFTLVIPRLNRNGLSLVGKREDGFWLGRQVGAMAGGSSCFGLSRCVKFIIPATLVYSFIYLLLLMLF